MNPGFAKGRIKQAIAGKGSTIVVRWSQVSGGTADGVTGAIVGGVETSMSGTLRGFVHQESAATKLRQFSEVQVGDMLVDLDPDIPVTLYDGQMQSGTLPLDDLKTAGVRFEIGLQQFTQADIGEELASAWNVIFQDQTLVRTMLLRKAT